MQLVLPIARCFVRGGRVIDRMANDQRILCEKLPRWHQLSPDDPQWVRGHHPPNLLCGFEPNNPQYTCMYDIARDFHRHVGEMETEVLPILRKHLHAQQLQHMSILFQALKVFRMSNYTNRASLISSSR